MNGSCSLCNSQRRRHKARQERVFVTVVEDSVSASLDNGVLSYSADVQNISENTPYDTTIQANVSNLSNFGNLLSSETLTTTVEIGETVTVSNEVQVSPPPGANLNVCLEVTSITPAISFGF